MTFIAKEGESNPSIVYTKDECGRPLQERVEYDEKVRKRPPRLPSSYAQGIYTGLPEQRKTPSGKHGQIRCTMMQLGRKMISVPIEKGREEKPEVAQEEEEVLAGETQEGSIVRRVYKRKQPEATERPIAGHDCNGVKTVPQAPGQQPPLSEVEELRGLVEQDGSKINRGLNAIQPTAAENPSELPKTETQSKIRKICSYVIEKIYLLAMLILEFFKRLLRWQPKGNEIKA